ncbi:hypothetical protein CHUAL_007790 [Chamberlinius hualienensis]
MTRISAKADRRLSIPTTKAKQYFAADTSTTRYRRPLSREFAYRRRRVIEAVRRLPGSGKLECEKGRDNNEIQPTFQVPNSNYNRAM